MIHGGPARLDFLRGTLDLLIPRTLMAGPGHGHAIARRIQTTGRKQLAGEQSKCSAFTRAVGLILKPSDQEAQ